MPDVAAVMNAYLVLSGLIVGSFINLAADRVPRRESLLRPRSHCRACGRVLNAIDLLPVVGYVVRGGRCATCRSPIGHSAPLVEIVSGACMLAGLALLGTWPGAVAGFAMVGAWGLGVTAFAVRRRSGLPARV